MCIQSLRAQFDQIREAAENREQNHEYAKIIEGVRETVAQGYATYQFEVVVTRPRNWELSCFFNEAMRLLREDGFKVNLSTPEIGPETITAVLVMSGWAYGA